MELISIGETHRIREFYYSADFASPWTRRILATNDTSPQPSPEQREKYHPGSFCPFSSGKWPAETSPQPSPEERENDHRGSFAPSPLEKAGMRSNTAFNSTPNFILTTASSSSGASYDYRQRRTPSSIGAPCP
jgi:hypothetical protein